MSEVVAIRPGVKIEPADQQPPNIQVEPQLRVVETTDKQPEQPKKRDLLKGLAALFGGFATFGAAKALQSETGQKILAASPFTQHPIQRPPVEQQLNEIRQDIRSKNVPNDPPGYDTTTLGIMEKIKKENQAKKEN